ncbi:DUF2690 domain-containing protein [Kitasatospora sp. NPDC059146]|uniref:DUF2690 domain-containing protein n=1 Tax=Kitasatospora sp. NPDC059146 TaxID=3346741 RepID=UPI0036C4C045
MTTKKVLGTVAAVLALTALLPAAGTAEAATCRGDACTGKNPKSTGCGDDAKSFNPPAAVTPAGGGPTAELRMSPSCSAAWARIEKANGNWRFKIEIKDGKSYIENASPDFQAYTPMVGTSNAYRVCVEQYDGVGGSWSCTAWH